MSNTLTVTAGKPFNQQVLITDAKDVWPSESDCEVRAQLRQGKSTATPLIANLHDHMTWAIVANDLVITWTMDGEQTREFFALTTWPKRKRGYFNIIVSDIGTEDDNAIVVPVITLKAEDTTTTAVGSV